MVYGRYVKYPAGLYLQVLIYKRQAPDCPMWKNQLLNWAQALPQMCWHGLTIFSKNHSINTIRLLRNGSNMKLTGGFCNRITSAMISGWMDLDGQKRFVNNWNVWLNYNALTCILLVEDDAAKRAEGVYKSMRSVDRFINYYKDDGGCEEGPAYWSHAGGMLFNIFLY